MTITDTSPATIDTQPSTPLLTAADRCDACGARAYAKAIIDVSTSGHEKSLLFCGHHWNRHKTKLLEVALVHHDETALIGADRGGAGGAAFA